MLSDAFDVFSNLKGLKGQHDETVCANESGTFSKPILSVIA